MRHLLRLLGPLFGLFEVATPYARTWHVTPDGTGDAPKIQAAIDSSSAGDSVLVAAGFYDENLDTQGKALSLIGAGGRDATVVDAGRRARVLSFNSGLVTGFTFRNGLAQVGGGGILIKGPNSTVLRNNVIEENIAGTEPDTGGGGGVYIDHLASGVLIESNIIRNNISTAIGGGIRDAGPSPQFILNEIRNNVISGNRCRYFGGGIALFAAVVSGNLVIDNQSEGAGAGIAADFADLPVGEIVNNTIVRNRAGSQGAGILVVGGSPLISNNIVAWNEPGGGILYTGSREPICNDLWANDVDAIGWSGVGNGNFSADPLFCNTAEQNYSVYRNSPCLATANPTCGLVGAFDEGCTVPVNSVTWTHVKKLFAGDRDARFRAREP